MKCTQVSESPEDKLYSGSGTQDQVDRVEMTNSVVHVLMMKHALPRCTGQRCTHT